MGTYQPLLGRNGVLALLVASVAWTGWLVFLELSADPLRWWWLSWLGGSLAWNVYWWGLRIATGFRVDGRHLHWQVALRAGAVPLIDLASVRSLPLLTGVVVVRGAGMPWLIVLPQKGFGPFARSLVHVVPGVDIDLRPWARLPERMPGRTAWVPDTGERAIFGALAPNDIARAAAPSMPARAPSRRPASEPYRPRHLRRDPPDRREARRSDRPRV